MSDTSQGSGWWQASDGKWYEPESNPDRMPPSPVATAEAPAAGSKPVMTSSAALGADDSGALRPVPNPMQWVMIGACAVGILGTLTTWITASAGFFSVSLNGTSTDDGKIAVVLALLATVATLVNIWKPRRVLAIASVALFGLLAILSIYEVFNISSKSYSGDGISVTASVGIGVYLCLLGGVAGVVAWIINWRQTTPSGAAS